MLSRSLDLPATAQLWQQDVASTLLAHSVAAAQEPQSQRLVDLQRRGVELELLERCEPLLLLSALAGRGCNRVLWECGPALAAAALQQGCVQEIAAVIAPKLLGGELARTPLGDLGFTAMDQVQMLSCESARRLGNDLLLQAQLSSCATQN